MSATGSIARSLGVPLSVLDVVPVPSGQTAADALQNTLRLASHAEALGMHRYWLAEHHNAGALASSAPEILIAAVAARTHTIRVGSGGIMLPNHAELHVAEMFRALEGLFPGRIDLGVGRAAGTDKATARRLRRHPDVAAADTFEPQLAALLAFLGSDPDPTLPFNPTKASPVGVPAPATFVLGASETSARLAGELGLGYAFAHHFAPDGAASAIASYRASFRPSSFRAVPYAIVAAAVLCGEDDAHAETLARSGDVLGLRFGRGVRDLPLPSVTEAAAVVFDADDETLRATARRAWVVGGPETVRRALGRLVEATAADEVMITTMVHDHGERERSYGRLFASPSRPSQATTSAT